MSASPDKNSSVEHNPLKTDPELKALLVELESVNNANKFRKWKGSFLKRYETFIEQDGIAPAQKEYDGFSADLRSFHGKCIKLEDAVSTGALTKTSVSVKGRNALNEMNKTSAEITERLLALLPTTGAEEKKCKYSKFQLGAILVRDNFMAYDTMAITQSILLRLKDDPLSMIADRQIIDQIDYYCKKIQNFCDIMASLALYEVMNKCRKYGMGTDQDIVLFIDCKTGQIGELSRTTLIATKIFTVTSTPGTINREKIEEASFGEDRDEIITAIKEKLKL